MNPTLRKLQDEKAAIAVEKKVRKPRTKKTSIVEIPEKHEHCMQLNTPATPQPLRDFHYFKVLNKAARRNPDNTITYMTEDLGRSQK